jgi:hypothetical protein
MSHLDLVPNHFYNLVWLCSSVKAGMVTLESAIDSNRVLWCKIMKTLFRPIEVFEPP